MNLVLLFGMPRSGTTWIGKIFDSHPATVYRHEPDTYRFIEDIPLFAEAGDYLRYQTQVEPYVRGLENLTALRVTGKLPLFRKNYLAGWRFPVYKNSVLFSKLMSRVGVSLPLVNPAHFDHPSNAWLVWKSIESSGRLGVIMRCLPDAKAILILRHPCGFVASILRGERQGSFSDMQPSSEDYGIFSALLNTTAAQPYHLTLETLQKLTPVERIAWRWLLCNEKAVRDIADLPNAKIMIYEELCRHPLQETQQLFSFAGLPWHSQTEEFIASSTQTENSSYYSVFKNPLKSAEKWKDELSADQVRQVERVVRDSLPWRLYGQL